MFNFIEDGESYIDFGNPNYMTNYPNVDPATASNWFVFNKQRVYYNEGQLLGHGGWYVKLDGETPPTYLGEWSDGSANVKFREKKGDPILQFEGVINETKIEHYESSKALRSGVGNLNTGSNYEDYDRAPSVNMWLGRSWIENEHEELYFLVESREMLDEVATYYGLPVPYDDEMKVVLDNNLQSIRFKSYDLNHEGEGNFVAVVVAGIVFKDDTATMLKLYETTRWDE